MIGASDASCANDGVAVVRSDLGHEEVYPFLRICVVAMRGVIDAMVFVGVVRLLIASARTSGILPPGLGVIVTREPPAGSFRDESDHARGLVGA